MTPGVFFCFPKARHLVGCLVPFIIVVFTVLALGAPCPCDAQPHTQRDHHAELSRNITKQNNLLHNLEWLKKMRQASFDCAERARAEGDRATYERCMGNYQENQKQIDHFTKMLRELRNQEQDLRAAIREADRVRHQAPGQGGDNPSSQDRGGPQ